MPGVHAATGKVQDLLDSQPSRRRTDTLKELNAQNPEIVATGLKRHLDTVIDDVFHSTDTGRPTEAPGKAIATALSEQKTKGLHEAFDIAADGMKVDASRRAAWHRGLDRLRAYSQANARAPIVAKALSSQETLRAMQSLGRGEALQLLGIALGPRAARLMRPWMGKRSFAELDKLLSDPSVDSVEKLIKLGQGRPVSRGQQTLVASLAASLMANESHNVSDVTSRNEEEPN